MELPALSNIISSKTLQRPTVKKGTVIIILALVAIFSTALMMRMQPARYGFYLHEYDPYFDYYATDFIVKNTEQHGLGVLLSDDPNINYFKWRDYRTWYPEGRPVASSSQVGLHFAGAFLYLAAKDLFGLNTTLYDFTVLFPAVLGALTTLAMYLLVKRISSVSAGLLAALVIAFSPPIIQRGALGWYKSEPLALFLTTLGSYFFLTIYDEKASRTGLILRASAAGILLGYANTAWGGSLYFNAVFGALLFITPFLKADLRRTVYLGSVFVAFNLIFSAIFPRPGPSVISGPAGIVLLGGLLFTIIAYRIKSTVDPKVYVKSLVKAALVFVLIGLVVLSFGAVTSLSGRYQTVLDPFLRTENPLIESVAEHQTPTGAEYLSSYLALLFLAGFGTMMTVRRRSVAAGYTLILALSAIYISSSFARLMVFSSLAFAILAGVGLHELTLTMFKPPAAAAVKKKFRLHEVRSEVKVAYSVFMISIIAFPIVYPSPINWVETSDFPTSISSSSTNLKMSLSDWLDTLSWIRHSTPPYQPDGKPTVLAAWWDYGYWISVMGNRTSLADNATINQTRIAQLGRMFMSDEAQSVKILKDLKADYVVIFVAGQSFTFNNQKLSILGTYGDESKKQWFIRIGGLNETLFVEEDEFTPKQYFWENTLLGKMIPFTFVSYIDYRGEQVAFSNKTRYERGLGGVYAYDVKYPAEGPGPLRLAYMSQSLAEQKDGIFAGVIIYEIVKK